MTDIPQIKTQRLVMRGPVEADFESYATFYTSDATEFISGPLTLVDAWQMFASDAGHWALKGFGWWTVTENDRPVGCVGLHHPPDHDDIEIGWNVYEGARGRGIAGEAANAALLWAGKNLRGRPIVSYIADGNTASIALALRLGATKRSERSSHNAENAIYAHDMTRYAI
ncbi:MAG: GNAT family N-acetyltransferase [Pseudomonadota bacterium]